MPPGPFSDRALTPPIGIEDADLSVVVVLQHDPDDGPCYFSSFLRQRGINYVHIRAFLPNEASRIPRTVQRGLRLVKCPDVPCVYHLAPLAENEAGQKTEGTQEIETFHRGSPILAPRVDFDLCGSSESIFSARVSGVASFGGFMSVNDNLPYFDDVFALYQSAIRHEVPVIGHCLGAQLLSRCLGGEVKKNPVAELGWTTQEALYPCPTTRPYYIKNWFGDFVESLPVYEWHGETFSIPSGCHLVAAGPYCENQAFQYGDKYVLGMQFHVEVDEEKMNAWICTGHPALFSTREEKEAAANDHANPKHRFVSPATMTIEELCDKTCRMVHLEKSKALADRVYSTWLEGLRL